MITELIMVGGVAFWVITAIILLIILSLVEVTDEAPVAAGVLVVYAVILMAFSNITLSLSKHWWMPIPYLIIGALWFLFLMTYRLRTLRKFLDENPSQRECIEGGGSLYSLPIEYRRIYETEPSFTKFCDRILFWPISMLKFFLSDMTKAIYDSVVDYLVNYKNNILGVKKR